MKYSFDILYSLFDILRFKKSILRTQKYLILKNLKQCFR